MYIIWIHFKNIYQEIIDECRFSKYRYSKTIYIYIALICKVKDKIGYYSLIRSRCTVYIESIHSKDGKCIIAKRVSGKATI